VVHVRVILTRWISSGVGFVGSLFNSTRPKSIAPFDVHLVGLGKPGTEEHALAEKLYGELQEVGFDVVYDDRDAGPGEKFADAELLGVPLRLTIGRRTIGAGEIEVQIRRGRESRSLPLEGAAEAALEMWRSAS